MQPLENGPPTCGLCGQPVSEGVEVCGDCTQTWSSREGKTGAPPPAIALGRVVDDKWRLERQLGHGGMGVVYLAQDLQLDRKVAVKFLQEHLCDDPKYVARFEREARLTARLEHPNIATVYAVGREGRRPFIVMKYLEGVPLSRYLRSAPLPMPLREVVAIARQLCAALDAVHRHGFVHRDVKPGNIFLGPDGTVTLLDFGILQDGSSGELTRTSERLGTPSYMAPEQRHGGPVGPQCDVYALGIVLIEMLSGRSDWSAAGMSAAPIRDVAPWIPEPAARILEKTLSPDPRDRPQTAAMVLDVLEHCVSAQERLDAPAAKRRMTPRTMAVAALTAVIFAAAAAAAVRVTGDAAVPQQPRAAPIAAAAPEPPEAVATPPVASPAAAPNPPKLERAAGGGKARESEKRPVAAVGELRVVTVADGRPTWARVLLDGRKRGNTPLALKLAHGTHTVRVEREGFRSVERRVRLEPGGREIVRIELER